MIIVSQDKTKMINFERITEITASGTKILVGDDIFIPKGEEIATYETEERAREVFAEIYKKYSDWQSMRMIKNENIQAKIVSGDNSKYFDVYMMPEK